MKKYIFIIFSALCLLGCTEKKKEYEKPKKNDKYVYIDAYGCLHLDQNCISFIYLKQLDDVINGEAKKAPAYMIEYKLKKELKKNSFDSYCCNCTNVEDYEEIERIINNEDTEENFEQYRLVFVSSKTTDTYHLDAQCKFLKGNDIIDVITLGEAELQNKKPCMHCATTIKYSSSTTASSYNADYAKKIYGVLINNGFKQEELGEEAKFVQRMSNEGNRRMFYNVLRQRGGKVEIGDWNKFNSCFVVENQVDVQLSSVKDWDWMEDWNWIMSKNNTMRQFETMKLMSKLK